MTGAQIFFQKCGSLWCTGCGREIVKMEPISPAVPQPRVSILMCLSPDRMSVLVDFTQVNCYLPFVAFYTCNNTIT